MPETRTIDQVGCARCNGEGHPGLLFRPFTRPVVLPGGPTFWFWSICPSTLEPILMAVIDAPAGLDIEQALGKPAAPPDPSN